MDALNYIIRNFYLTKVCKFDCTLANQMQISDSLKDYFKNLCLYHTEDYMDASEPKWVNPDDIQ